MIDVQAYMKELIEELKRNFGCRLVYVGLQGSYQRGEAQEESDIDPLVVLDEWTVTDLDLYRTIIEKLAHADKACGFICGKQQLACWNRLEICHLLFSTQDYVGRLSELVPAYDLEDVRQFVILSLNNMIHELCHRYLHAPRSKNEARLPQTYKGAFFILQGLCYLRHGVFPQKTEQMTSMLEGEDQAILERIIAFRNGTKGTFETDFQKLFDWCQHTVTKV